MTIQTQSQIEAVEKAGTKNCRNLKLPGADFTGKNLKNWDFRGASLPSAKFVNTDLTYANFEGATLTGSDLTGAVCHRTNFKDAKLSYCILNVKDFFACTITLECNSFQGIETTPGWWAGWLMYGLLMKPPSPDHRDRLIQAMGVDYWEVLRKQYNIRQM